MSKGLEALEKIRFCPLDKWQKQECWKVIEKELKTLAIISRYFYSKHIIHDLYCLGATDEEIKLVKEELENDN